VREALALALQDFEGAVIVVSHDRQLLSSVVDSFWLVHEGKVEPYDDDLDAYAQWMMNQRKVQIQGETQSNQLMEPVKPSVQDNQLHQLEHQLEKAKKDIESLKNQLLDFEQSELKQRSLKKRLETLEQHHADLENQWYKILS
jgi:ATP-binding cassette subfamily F protein 3